jgi:hypothetical protein
VVYDEGLRSCRAIVFIANKRKLRISKESICYLGLGASPQSTILTKQEATSGFFKNLGEKLWIK